MGVIVGILIGILSTIVGALLVATATGYWQRRTNRVARLIGLRSNRRVTFVVPGLPSTDPAHPRIISGDDMLAVHAIEGALMSAHWPRHWIDVEFASDVNMPTTTNVVTVCSVKRNEVTKAVLENPKTLGYLDCIFKPDPLDPTRWLMAFEGAEIRSPSYDETNVLRQQNRDPARGPLTDFALLARIPSPWDDEAKIVVAAGLRAFGTWGAAEHLQRNAEKLHGKTRGKDFAMVVRVTSKDFRVLNTEETAHFKVFG